MALGGSVGHQCSRHCLVVSACEGVVAVIGGTCAMVMGVASSGRSAAGVAWIWLGAALRGGSERLGIANAGAAGTGGVGSRDCVGDSAGMVRMLVRAVWVADGACEGQWFWMGGCGCIGLGGG